MSTAYVKTGYNTKIGYDINNNAAIIISSSENSKGEDFHLKFHEEEQHKEYCEENKDNWQKRREYEMMLMRRFNLKKEISSLQRCFAANEVNIKDYETDEDTKEFAYEVRERAWKNRARKNSLSDTSLVDEHLELGYYILTSREKELAAAALSDTALVMEDNLRRLKKLSALHAQNEALQSNTPLNSSQA
jgi:hypothetical protein